ncbi:MAG: hypothetical protein IJ774_03675 [Selenomonadaceae bacterium]|nr:hypothetical protein [Selenomonadaceae bacterium]
MLGQIELENFTALTEMPQKAASAWSEVERLVGASFKPILYLGTQIVHGVNHWFLAERTIVALNSERRLVKLAVNELGGKFKFVANSVQVVA